MSKKELDLRVFGLVRLGEKGQIVIPVAARAELNMNAGDEVLVIGSPSRKFIGVIREEDFREMLTKTRERIEQGLAMGESFANVAQQLDELKK